MSPVCHAPKCIQLLKLLVGFRPKIGVDKVPLVFNLLSLDMFLAHLTSIEEFSEVNLIVTTWLSI